MHKFWMLFDPRRACVAIAVWAFTLAIIIHFVLLSSPRYNWLDTAPAVEIEVSSLDVATTKPRQS